MKRTIVVYDMNTQCTFLQLYQATFLATCVVLLEILLEILPDLKSDLLYVTKTFENTKCITF